MPIYHVGLIDNNKIHYNPTNTVTMQVVKNKDRLSPDLWQYYGQRETTKKQLISHKKQLLAGINSQYKKNFEKIFIQ